MMFDIVDLPDKNTLKKLSRRYPMMEIPALEAWLNLMRVSSDCQEDLDRFLAGHNISQRKFFVLLLLLRNPDGLKISRLASGTGVSCATMTGVVDGLLNGKLVTRETDKMDRRVFWVNITGEGRKLLDQILPLHYERIGLVMSFLDEGERVQLERLLGKVAAGLARTGPD